MENVHVQIKTVHWIFVTDDTKYEKKSTHP